VERFEANRTRLQAVAYRLPGSVSEAHTSEVENLSGWLPTGVALVYLAVLASVARRNLPLQQAETIACRVDEHGNLDHSHVGRFHDGGAAEANCLVERRL
jgi:hypothetical protein